LLKQHYPSSPLNSIATKRGRYKEGTPRLGETELLSMMTRKHEAYRQAYLSHLQPLPQEAKGSVRLEA